ncbi:hypothetical protein BU197_10560 [Streptomyces sp. CBMA291]|nr:hypothetical protein [Streptomyces sp. CBMA291]MBD0717043.1 hypothetical protein [Streptomyces sp. CBMA370]
MTAGLTDAETARIAARGPWAPDGTVEPGAVRLGQTLAQALLDGTPDAVGPEPAGLTATARELLPAGLAAVAEEVLRRARPAYHRVEGGSDDVRLSAFSLRQRGPGPHPLVVLPAGWTPYGWPLFLWTYLVLARKGYHVLAYTPRGLGIPGLPSTSGGLIDVAGPHDWADGSAVIDFAVDHFAPGVIGFMGESYGSGISQLVAAHDDRVSAVVALSTWGNLATALYDHGTRHLAAVRTLLRLTGGPAETKFDKENQRVLADFQADRNLADIVEWGRRRAPESYVDLTNDKGTPTFFSNTWHESLFPVNQVVTTFDRLDVPKRLNLWIGDHAVPEGPGLIGPPGETDTPLAEAYAWLDHHLKGEQAGVARWPEVCAQVMFTYTTARDPGGGGRRIVTPARRETHARWGDLTRTTEVFALTGDGAGGADGRLLPTGEGREPAETGWRRAFLAGVGTEATAMDAIMETGRAEWTGDPRTYDTRKFDRRHSVVWTTEPFAPQTAEGTGGRTGTGGTGGADGPPALRIRGVPRLRLTVRSTTASASLYAYLFDVAEDDTARIVTHEPHNLRGLAPDRDATVTWRLQATAYDLAAGHRLMLVVDSKDPLYADVSVTWTRTAIGSPAAEPSFLELPLG